MLDVKYYKDYRHNYLILKCGEEQDINTYQRRMITSNTINGLLKCQERHVNGEVFLYYEITSRQSLACIYGERSIGPEVLHHFFKQLKLVNDTLQKYLLEDKGLVLCPEYIFQELETGEISFLYYPEDREEGLAGLMDFFIEKVDDENAKAVETVYKIADLIHREQFVLDEVLDWLEDSAQESSVTNRNGYEQQEKEKESIDAFVMNGRIVEEQTGDEELTNYSKRWPEAFLGAGFLGMGILFYIMHAYHLSNTGKLLLAAGWSVVVLLLAGAAFGYIHRIYGSSKKYPSKEKEHISYERTDLRDYEVQNVQAADGGNTVFIPWTDSCENRLYGMNKGNKYHIDLGYLPLTVGKLAGAVDMVINEQGISRMHARFSRVGGKICITDLNSTNGTFKNGLRLQPNDSEMIEPGDEIRLGKLKFIYR